MKKSIVTLVSMVVASLVAQAETGSGYNTLSEYGRKSVSLEHCGGVATLSQRYVDGQTRPVLTFSRVKDCSNIKIDGEKRGKLDTDGNNRSGEVVVYESRGTNVHIVTLSSNSGATEDTIRVETYKEQPSSGRNPSANIVFDFGFFGSVLGLEKSASLRDCGGNVTVKVDLEQVNLVFREVQNCSKFDILGSNGESVDYPRKSLNDSRAGYSGSFTIPQRFIRGGGNAVKVILRSNTGFHDEVILIRFLSI